MTNARPQSNGGPLTLRLSPGPSPRIRWGERIPLQATTNGGVIVDLSDIQFAEPTLALRLAASEAVHAADGAPFKIIPPDRRQVRDYLARAGLAEQMGSEELPDAPDVLLPVTRIAACSDVEPIAERLAQAASELPTRLAPASDALLLALSELCDNACSHGANEHGTFVLAQRFGSTRLVLTVGDLGVGIPVHLGEAMPRARGRVEQGKLIAHALERGVTGVQDEVRGNGLPQILQTIREAGMPAAELGIWSGIGRVSVQMRSRPATRRRIADVTSYTQGTWSEVVLASSQAGRT